MGKLIFFVTTFALFVTFAEANRYLDLSCHSGYSSATDNIEVGEGYALKVESVCQPLKESSGECTYKHCILKLLGILNSTGEELSNVDNIKIDIRRFFKSEGYPDAEPLAQRIHDQCLPLFKNSKFQPCEDKSNSVYDCIEKALRCGADESSDSDAMGRAMSNMRRAPPPPPPPKSFWSYFNPYF